MKGGLQNLMKQAQQMQKKMERMQAELGEKEVEVSSGGGMVTARVNGHKRLVKLTIDPEAVDPEDVEMLEDLIVAAVNEGVRKAEEEYESEMSKIMPPGMAGGLPGLF